MDEYPTITPPSGIDVVLGSTARIRVARLLVELPDKEFIGREMARILGMSHSTVLDALRGLAREGLVHERVLGRAHVFRVNRDHYLFEILATFFGSERTKAREITDLIRSSLKGTAVSVILFGSRAGSAAKRGSDVDLLVVSGNVVATEAAVARLRAQLGRRYGLALDAKVLATAELKSKLGAPFVRAALAEGRVIAGAPLENVRARAA
jgi:predicted nucleotidyltransferase